MGRKTLTQNVPLLSALHNAPFTLLWGGQVFSRLGNSIYNIALVWFVLQLTGSATATGLLLVVGILPNLLFSLLGGALADRVSRRTILLWSDLLRAAAMFLLSFLIWRNLLSYWHLVVVTLLFGIVGCFFLPAYQAIIPQLLSKEDRPSATALNSLGTNVSQIAGPLLGSLCIAFAGPISAFIFNGFTFVVSALCIFLMPLPQEEEQGRRPMLSHVLRVRGASLFPALQSITHDIREAILFVRGIRWLWITLVLAAIANLGFGAPLVVLPKLVTQGYGMGIWLLGTINGVGACAAILVNLWLGYVGVTSSRMLKAYGALLISSLGLLFFGLPLPHVLEPIIACFASFLYSFGLSAFTFIWVLLLQDGIPDEKRGRVFSLDLLGSTCMVPLGYALSGYLADNIGPAKLFIGSGIFTGIIVLIGLLIKDIRKGETEYSIT